MLPLDPIDTVPNPVPTMALDRLVGGAMPRVLSGLLMLQPHLPPRLPTLRVTLMNHFGFDPRPVRRLAARVLGLDLAGSVEVWGLHTLRHDELVAYVVRAAGVGLALVHPEAQTAVRVDL